MSRFLCVGSASGAPLFAADLTGLVVSALVFFGFVLFAGTFLAISAPELMLLGTVTYLAVGDPSDGSQSVRVRTIIGTCRSSSHPEARAVPKSRDSRARSCG